MSYSGGKDSALALHRMISYCKYIYANLFNGGKSVVYVLCWSCS